MIKADTVYFLLVGFYLPLFKINIQNVSSTEINTFLMKYLIRVKEGGTLVYEFL